jgi:hypothetical protein
MKTIVALAAVAALSTACISQQPSAAERPFVVEPGETKLIDFVDRCAAHLQWNVLVAEQEVSGASLLAVRLHQRIEVDRAGCEDLLATMLARSGLVLTALDEQKRLYEVLNTAGPRGREIAMRATRRTPDQILARPALCMPVTTVVQLQHINATIATNALRPFFASVGHPSASNLTIGNIGNNTGLLLSGLQNQVATAIELVREADVPERPELDWDKGGKKLWDRLDAIERRLAELEQKRPQQQPR